MQADLRPALVITLYIPGQMLRQDVLMAFPSLLTGDAHLNAGETERLNNRTSYLYDTV